MFIYINALLAVLAVSLFSLVGVITLSLREEVLRKYISIFISLAVGALLGDAFIHLIPEALGEFENQTVASILIIAGILIFFVIEKFLHWHHHGEDKDSHFHPVGKLVMFSDGVHNFIDGIIIGASFFVSLPAGIATTVAVILHEIPQEIGDFAVLLHAGYSKARALWINFLSAVASILGVLVVFILGNNISFLSTILPIASGGFIYIALADLIPELQKTKSLKYSLIQIAVVIVGVLAMAALTLLE